MIISISKLLCAVRIPKMKQTEDASPTLNKFGRSQLQEPLLCCTHTVQNGCFIAQNTPEDKQASLATVQAHVCTKQPEQTLNADLIEALLE